MMELGNFYKIQEKKDESIPDKDSIIKITSEETETYFYELLYGNYIYTKRFKKNSGFLDCCKKISLEEIQQYLPEGHPDKIQVAANWWLNLKPGDKIKCTEVEQKGPNSNIYGGAGWKSNEVFTVRRVDNYETYGVIFIEEYGQDGIYDTSCAPYSEPKPLTVDDLVEGEVYYHKCLQYSYIVKFKKLDGISITGEYYIDLETNNYSKNYRNTSITELRPATPSEKKWLLTCIKQNKFIEQSELDKYDDEGNLIEVKPTFKFNKWYKYPNKKTLIFIKDDLKDCYGFTAQGWWKNNWDISDISLSNYIPATPEEVKERLLSYAKEKYPVGTKIIDVNRKKEVTVYSDYFGYYDDTQHITYGESVYLKGEWAEIIYKPESKTTEVDRNVYYEVSNREQYNEILDWLESKGEKIDGAYSVTDTWKYVIYDVNIEKWGLSPLKSNLSKAEFKFKNTPKIGDVRGISMIDVMKDYSDNFNQDIYHKSELQQSHRIIPQIEKVTNRFKASPVRKRNLPEIF